MIQFVSPAVRGALLIFQWLILFVSPAVRGDLLIFQWLILFISPAVGGALLIFQWLILFISPAVGAAITSALAITQQPELCLVIPFGPRFVDTIRIN